MSMTMAMKAASRRGGPAGITPDFDPLVRFTSLTRLPNYLPPIQ